jgi:acyl-coenzyme A thioesterase PaaI-like protein
MHTSETELRVPRQFGRQPFMRLLVAQLLHVQVGKVTVELTIRPELGQQHGFVHVGAVPAVLDTACGSPR